MILKLGFSDIPLSLANAFEKAIPNRGDGYLKPSAEALISYWNSLRHGYGLEDHFKLFTLVDGIQVIEQLDDKILTLKSLLDWIITDG